MTTPRSQIRLLIVDNHAMISDAFQLLLGEQEGIEVVGTAATSSAALSAVATLRPDVILLDHCLPDVDGVVTATIITTTSPGISVILMIDAYDEATVAAALAAGCAGVVDKDRSWIELVAAIRAVHEGETAFSQADLRRILPRLRSTRSSRVVDLTDREREVLECITEGLSNRAIAERLEIAPNTIRNHVQRILYKLNVHSKLQAVIVANHERQLTSARAEAR